MPHSASPRKIDCARQRPRLQKLVHQELFASLTRDDNLWFSKWSMPKDCAIYCGDERAPLPHTSPQLWRLSNCKNPTQEKLGLSPH